jgi:hypothetical protein
VATTARSKRSRKAKPPTVEVTLALFDTREPIYREKRRGVPIAEFLPLTRRDYGPSGGTPLLDATARFIGQLSDLRRPGAVTLGLLLDESGSMGGNEASIIEGVNQFVDGLRSVDAVSSDADDTVLAVIVTDGLENSSREVNREQLAALIAEKEEDGFTFIFLGANIDAWGEGRAMGLSGVPTSQTVNFVSTPVGTANAMSSVATDASMYLSSVSDYKASRLTSSSRSINEDGSESLSNVASGGSSGAVSGVTSAGGTFGYSWGDPDAIKSAQDQLRGS